MVPGIITAAIMSDPLTVRVNVRSVRMTFLVAIVAVFWRAGLLNPGRCSTTGLCRAGRLNSLLTSSRRWTMRRDVSTTSTLTATGMLLAAFVPALRKSISRKH